MKKNSYNCPAELTCKLLGGKWKSAILFKLRRKNKRFGELKRELTGISQSTLSKELRDLENFGLITREQLGKEKHEGVLYFLTEKGKTLRPVLNSLIRWGINNKAEYVKGEFNILNT